MLYAGSMMMYGEQPDAPIKEDALPDPHNLYAISKWASEKMCNVYAKDSGLVWTAMRMPNVYGAGQNMDNMKQGMVSIFLRYLLDEKPVLVKGPLERFRDFVEIEDVVNAWLAAYDNQEKAKNVGFNLCTGVRTTVGDLINHMIKAFGHDEYEVISEGSTPGDLFGIYGSYDMLNKALGWEPKVKLANGIQRTVDYLKAQKINNPS